MTWVHHDVPLANTWFPYTSKTSSVKKLSRAPAEVAKHALLHREQPLLIEDNSSCFLAVSTHAMHHRQWSIKFENQDLKDMSRTEVNFMHKNAFGQQQVSQLRQTSST